MILPLVHRTAPVLRKQAKEVMDVQTPEFQKLIDDMGETMLHVDGLGLAAPQIGESIRLVVINTKDGPVAYINPIIHHASFFTEAMEEGCLSLPGIFGVVSRSTDVDVTVTLRNGTRKRFIAHGMHARVIQHEVDHLNGTLFIDRADPRTIVQEDKRPETYV